MGIDQESWEKDHPPERRDCVPGEPPQIERHMAGIIEAAKLVARQKEEPPQRVILDLETDLRTGYVKAICRTTGIAGDERKDLRGAVESLYTRLTAKANEEARRAAEMLTRLGVK